MKKIIAMALCLVLSFSMMACDSKESAHEVNTVPVEPEETPETDVANGSFFSFDGNVEYYIPDTEELTIDTLPVVEVEPRSFSETDAAEIASTFIGQLDYYEYESDRTLTQAEREGNIARWESFLQDGIISDLFPGDPLSVQNFEEVLDRFREKYAEAPDSDGQNSFIPCDWAFHPDSFYYDYAEEAGASGIKVMTYDNEIKYRYEVVNYGKDDYSVHIAYAFIENDSSPLNIDSLVQEYELCKSAEPSAQQIDTIKNKVQSGLDSLGIGKWKIDACEVSELSRGTKEAYKVTVKAAPVFGDTPVIRQPQLECITNDGAEHQHYFYTDAEFTYAPDGTLLGLTLQAPFEIIQIEESPEVISKDELHSFAETALAKRGIEAYQDGSDPFYSDVSAKVYVKEMHYGLSRIETETGKSYKYVPSICLDGYFEIYDESGNLITDSSQRGMSRFLVISAVDGEEICFGIAGRSSFID